MCDNAAAIVQNATAEFSLAAGTRRNARIGFFQKGLEIALHEALAQCDVLVQ